MKCPACENRLSEVDEEFVCDDCGAAFGLEYLGMYLEGSSVRIDSGFEPKEWREKYREKIRSRLL